MVVEIACGVNHAWCGWGPKPPSSLVVRRGKIPLLLAASSYSFFLRITLPTGLLVSKVLNG